MRNALRRGWRAGVAALALWCSPVWAGIIVGQFDWNEVDDLEGWDEDQDWVSLDNPNAGGIGNTGYLRISLEATDTEEGDPGAEWWALTSVTPASSLFAGNWYGMWVAFNFFAEDIEPEYVQVRWQSSTNADVWRATVFDADESSMAVGSWTQFVAPQFTSYLDWDYGGGSQEQFVNDLASMDWIGVYIWRNTDIAQDFGIDDFRLMVPEPAETALLGSALVTALLSLRRRLSSAAGAKLSTPPPVA